jgi:hypothetical protein
MMVIILSVILKNVSGVLKKKRNVEIVGFVCVTFSPFVFTTLAFLLLSWLLQNRRGSHSSWRSSLWHPVDLGCAGWIRPKQQVLKAFWEDDWQCRRFVVDYFLPNICGRLSSANKCCGLFATQQM